jgi:predicted O-methyltransferase YrrM
MVELKDSGTETMDNQVVKDIIGSGFAIDKSGIKHKIGGNINQSEGEYLWRLILNNKFQRSVETGGAYCVSSLYICDAISRQASPYHIIIDPCQTAEWHNIGRDNLDRAGFRFYKLIEEPSEIALPRLWKEEEKFDFAFIDGWHSFYQVLIDFFYLDKMLRVGGVIAFHDSGFRCIHRAIRCIMGCPNYVLLDAYGTVSQKRRLMNKVKKIANLFVRFIPRQIAEELFDAETVRPDYFCQLHCSLILLRKVSNAEREPYWYKHF